MTHTSENLQNDNKQLPDQSWKHNQGLVQDKQKRNEIIVLCDQLPLAYQKGEVCQSGGNPASALFVELIKVVWAVSAVFCRCTVLQSPTTLNHQGAQPAVFTFRKIDKFLWNQIPKNSWKSSFFWKFLRIPGNQVFLPGNSWDFKTKEWRLNYLIIFWAYLYMRGVSEVASFGYFWGMG